jgi:hypothetical protein
MCAEYLIHYKEKRTKNSETVVIVVFIVSAAAAVVYVICFNDAVNGIEFN